MNYEIVDATLYLSVAPRKYEGVQRLEVGQALKIPLSDLSLTARDPASAVRSTARYWGKRLGWRFRTQIVGADIFLVRVT